MTTTKNSNGSGGLRLTMLVLSTAIGIGGASYGLMSSRVNDRCETIDAQVDGVRSDIIRNSGRLDREEAATAAVLDRLARIETKLDRLLLMEQRR